MKKMTLVAAAAALVCAGQAGAQTWTKYTATGSGSGIERNILTNGETPVVGDFSLTFYVETAPSLDYNNPTGNSFAALILGGSGGVEYAAALPGMLVLDVFGGDSQNILASFFYNQTTSSFPTGSTSLRGGGFDYTQYVRQADAFDFDGTPTLLSVSRADAFAAPTVSFNLSPVVPGAVPEPATWAMMALGFGLVGFGLRRQSKVTTKVSFA